MKVYTSKIETAMGRKVVADDMILTKNMATAAGSKMLDGYMSLFDAEVVTKLENAGFAVSGKTDVGEFAFDLVGESSYNGACEKDGKLVAASALALEQDDVAAAICLDVNGAVRRSAAQSSLISIKPTYGAVSRYGTIPVACSGETVSVLARTVKECREVLYAISGHDDKDGTSLPEELCEKIKTANAPVKKVAVLNSLVSMADSEVADKINEFCKSLEDSGVEVSKVDVDVICKSRAAWNILMSAELCNNVSRYDGVKYGYRSEKFTNIDELYTNSRTEAFGKLLKTAILFGSDALSTENYMKVYDKALRIRRVICEAFAAIFKEYNAVVMPACSKLAYTKEETEQDIYMCYKENVFTAPASITGLPAVVAGGVQLVGKAFSDSALLDAAQAAVKEEK